MFDKLKENIIREIAKRAYPGRDVDVIKIGGRFFVTSKDDLGISGTYLLKDTYSYNQVMKLNDLTGYNPSFGFCKEIGPVAFIGIPNPEFKTRSGYFKPYIHEYGTPLNEKEFYYEAYNEEDAKHIGNYTVYGIRDPRELEYAAPIDKLSYVYDYRYKCKDSHSDCYVRSALRMDVKLAGVYSFNDARMLAYGSTKKPEGYGGGQVPLKFAIVNGEPVGILNMWVEPFDAKFRDVWALNEEEPQESSIYFIPDDEAKKINGFKLYFYEVPYSFDASKYKIEKIDKTLEKGFNFTMEDGSDYRLLPSKVKNKEMIK